MSDILYNLIRRKDYVPDDPVCEMLFNGMERFHM